MAACSQFIFTEKLMPQAPSGKAPASGSTPEPRTPPRKSGKQMRGDTWLVNLLRDAVDQTMDEYGWAQLSDVGNYINNRSSFSPVNFGYKKLSNLVKEIDLFDIHVDEQAKRMSIRDKRLANH